MKVTNTPPGVQHIEKTQAPSKAGAKKIDSDALKIGHAAGGANVEISEDARIFQKTLDLVKSLPDTDKKEKVASLKKSIAAGTYKADTSAVADRLLDEHLKNDFGKNNI